jgi:hypothetical protein
MKAPCGEVYLEIRLVGPRFDRPALVSRSLAVDKFVAAITARNFEAAHATVAEVR